VRVVIACLDPNPVASGGLEKLRAAGVEVLSGVLEAEAATANDQFLTAMRLKRPKIVLKSAMSLDGRIALPSGESKWLTGPSARREAHRLRAECGAVLVGRRTVEADDPALTARIPGVVNQPVRVVLDPSAKLSSDWKVFDDSAPTLHVVDGWNGLRVGASGFDLSELASALFSQGIHGLLVEGGASTISAFLRAGLYDAVELFVAPKLLGDGPSWLQGLQLPHLSDAPELTVASVKRRQGDLQISLRRAQGN
jgi:diaminohydroxyphosphoribosylaminopyrimidine deaminase/5-amino-6-(5-phosphoribosylamino)uracil reductase